MLKSAEGHEIADVVRGETWRCSPELVSRAFGDEDAEVDGNADEDTKLANCCILPLARPLSRPCSAKCGVSIGVDGDLFENVVGRKGENPQRR